MADLVIRGLEMPEDCQYCPMAHWSKIDTLTGCDAVPGKRYIEETDTEFWQSRTRPRWCPLVPLPEGHGRLIDAEAYVDYMQNRYDNNEITNGDWIDFRLSLKYQPTIVPAEGGTDDDGNA